MNRPSSIDPLGNIATRSSYMRFFKENHPEDYVIFLDLLIQYLKIKRIESKRT